MIIQLKNGATKNQYNKITKDLINKGYEIKDVSSEQVIVFGVIGDTAALDERDMYAYGKANGYQRRAQRKLPTDRSDPFDLGRPVRNAAGGV